MKRRGYRIVGSVVAILLLGSQVILPMAAETMIERSLKRAVSLQEIAVDVDAMPAVSLANGEIDAVEMIGRQVTVGRVVCEEVKVMLSEVKIDRDHLWQDGKVFFHRVGDAHITASVTEDALARALRHSVKQLDDPTVTITPGGITASGTYSLGRMSPKITLMGQIVYRDNKIFFVSEQVQLQYGARGNFSADLRTEVELAELESLPFVVRITEIRPTDGRILLAFEKANEK